MSASNPSVKTAFGVARSKGHDSFSRECELPQYVDSDKVTAEFSHGALTITLPKFNAADAVAT